MVYHGKKPNKNHLWHCYTLGDRDFNYNFVVAGLYSLSAVKFWSGVTFPIIIIGRGDLMGLFWMKICPDASKKLSIWQKSNKNKRYKKKERKKLKVFRFDRTMIRYALCSPMCGYLCLCLSVYMPIAIISCFFFTSSCLNNNPTIFEDAWITLHIFWEVSP